MAMEANFQRALSLVLKHEGGWADHPADPGGATNKGITLATFRQYVKKNGTVADLKAITDAQVAQVYKAHYWNAVRSDQLPAGLDYAVFDFAVNSGPARAAKYLQRIVGVAQDGVIGPQTLAAVAKHDPAKLITRLCDDRLAFLKGLSTWPTFGKGWSRRVEDVRRDALAMVGAAQSPASDNTQAATSILSAIITFIAKLLRRA
jgi:lysozyme family protein